MNNKSIVKLSNSIGIISIILLMYWVFVFVSIQVFGLKVFRENMTESFYFSVMGILALMFGALMINIMFNLTRIADKHNLDNLPKSNSLSKKISIGIIKSFPIIFILLIGGDYLTSLKKKKMMISYAESIVDDNSQNINHLLNYSLDRKWLFKTANILELYSLSEKSYKNVNIIISDSIENRQIFLHFTSYCYKDENDTTLPYKKSYLFRTNEEERLYLKSVFNNKDKDLRFSASDGSYELFYPVIKNGKVVVLYLSEYQQYGKLGS